MAVSIGYPSKSLLSTEVVYHVGACDKTGHAIVVFPTSSHSVLADIPDNDLTELLQYLYRILPLQQRLNGISCLVNFHRASQAVITKLAGTLNYLQSENECTIHCLYAHKPKTSKNFEMLQKLTGHKTSKKNPVKKTYQLREYKDLASLHKLVDKNSLPEEFGGNLAINLPSWVTYRVEVDDITQAIERSRETLGPAKDQLQILCDIEIPANKEDNERILEDITAKYNSIMGDLNLEHVIDGCASILDNLSSTTKSITVVKHAQGELLKETVKYMRTNQCELTEAREQLQQMYRQAQARIIQAGQLHNHQRAANKIIKWIERKGQPKLEELDVSITSRKQVLESQKQIEELTSSFQELKQEAEYIATDVEFMVLDKSDDLDSPFRAFKRMTSDLEALVLKITELSTIFTTALTIYNNVDKCFNWYQSTLQSLPSRDVDWLAQCSQVISESQSAAPPPAWIKYIRENIACIEEAGYSDTVEVLFNRIDKLLSGCEETSSHDLTYVHYKIWITQLKEGFTGLQEIKLPDTKLPNTKLSDIKLPDSTASVAVHHDSTDHSTSNPSAASFRSLTPKLKPNAMMSLCTTSSTASSSESETQPKSPRRSRIAQAKDGEVAEVRCATDEVGPVEDEVYVDLSAAEQPVVSLPPSLSHIDLTKFIDNEPQDPPVVKVANQREAFNQPANQNTAQAHSAVTEQAKKKPVHQTKLQRTKGRTTRLKQNSIVSQEASSPRVKPDSRRRKPKRRLLDKYRGQKSDSDESDDTCPHSSHRGSTRLSIATATSCDDLVDGSALKVLESENLPYNPQVHQKQLDSIVTRTSPTALEKLDMMAALLETADDSCFEWKRSVATSRGYTRRSSTPAATQEHTERSRLTSSNISKELSSSTVGYPEHIYHWLKKQSEQSYPSEASLEPSSELGHDSVKECIERAERILEEDLPNFPPCSTTDRYVIGRRSGDVISKSGDSGITELTARDTLPSYGLRHSSKESGLDSENLTPNEPSNQSARPRIVPPLNLRRPINKRLEIQLSRPIRRSAQQPSNENF